MQRAGGRADNRDTNDRGNPYKYGGRNGRAEASAKKRFPWSK